VISLTDFFYAASRQHDDVIYGCQRYTECLQTVFQQDSAPAYCTAHVHQLNCCVKKHQTFLRPTCGLQTAQISVLWITRSWLSCSIVSTTDKSIVWMNWRSSWSMRGAVLNSRFLTRLLTSGEEDIERVSVLKEDISSTACELTVLILSSLLHSMWLVWLFQIMPATLANRPSCSFYKVMY